jgi:hypothetical protein
MTGGNNYGNRLDNRQRGNASQLLEKYRGLARDSQQAGDRVTAEYYLQYAEHYYRLLGDYRDRQGEPVRRPRDYEEEDSAGFNPNDADAEADGDGDDEDEPEPRREETRGERSDERPNERRYPDRQGRGDRTRPQQGRDYQRENGREQSRDPNRDQPRNRDWNRDERRPDERRPDEYRPDARAPERRAEPEPRFAPNEDVEGPIPGLPGPARVAQRVRDVEPKPAAQAQMAADVQESSGAADEDAPAPKRRGRPRKVVA